MILNLLGTFCFHFQVYVSWYLIDIVNVEGRSYIENESRGREWVLLLKLGNVLPSEFFITLTLLLLL